MKNESGSWDVWVGDAVVDKELVINKRVEKKEKILLKRVEVNPFYLCREVSYMISSSSVNSCMKKSIYNL